MILVQDIVVSEAIIEEQFMCNLNACKGACCWEGDYGAPLEEDELKILERIYDQLEPFLSKEGRAVLKNGLYTYNSETNNYETPLVNGKACAYLTYDQKGVAKCGIEHAYRSGAVDFMKPISCHLYPIRIKEEKKSGFVALNYDEWDICSAACTLGKQKQVAVYQFVKEAIVRKFGLDFYEELDAMASYLKNTTQAD